VGLDVHKATTTATALDSGGREVASWEFPTTGELVDEFARGLPRGASVGLEASTTGKAVYRRLQRGGVEVHMASPRQLHAITTSDVKTDRRDSYHLGHLLRNSYFPESYVPPVEAERVRDLVRFRMSLGQQVSEVKNRVHALVDKNLWNSEMAEFTDWFGKGGLERLAALPFEEGDRTLVHQHLEQLMLLVSQEERATEELARIGQGDRNVELLMSIPGINFYSALAILGEIGDVHRFPEKKSFYSYAGLVPRADNSGEKESKHRHVKRGNAVLKYFLVNAVHGAARATRSNSVAKFYRKKEKQIGQPKAQVAAARKLAGIVWKILLSGVPYEDEDPRLTKNKATRMRSTADRPGRAISAEQLRRVAERLGEKEGVLRQLSNPEAS
jgi:transposase